MVCSTIELCVRCCACPYTVWVTALVRQSFWVSWLVLLCVGEREAGAKAGERLVGCRFLLADVLVLCCGVMCGGIWRVTFPWFSPLRWSKSRGHKLTTLSCAHSKYGIRLQVRATRYFFNMLKVGGHENMKRSHIHPRVMPCPSRAVVAGRESEASNGEWGGGGQKRIAAAGGKLWFFRLFGGGGFFS